MTGYSHLEDEFGDVVGKARRGQELSVSQLASSSGLAVDALERVEAYELTPSAADVDRLAAALSLSAVKLRRSADVGFYPEQPQGRELDALDVRMLILGDDFLMNGYVVICRRSGEAAIIDPGFQGDRLLAAAQEAQARITKVLLTHGHGDHVGDVPHVLQATGVEAAISVADAGLAGDVASQIAGRLCPGETIPVGQQALHIVSTPGHTPGGVSLLHDEAAFVGDALFAGSLGGTRRRVDYQAQQQAVATELLSLPATTTLYPGHGPATTVAEERHSNPFFDESTEAGRFRDDTATTG